MKGLSKRPSSGIAGGVSGAKFEIPEEVSRVTGKLKAAGYEAYLIGGCVRDLFLGKKPKDWDVTTNATPEQIIATFEKTFYENSFGTVGVVDENTTDETLKVVEVTPYRTESAYSDKRRPDAVSFSKNLEDDLKRRDFTINAIAYNAEEQKTVDLYGGLADLSAGHIRAVGNAQERFAEDALRTIRAVRLSAQLGFEIEAGEGNAGDKGVSSGTRKAIADEAHGLAQISKERIRDEFIKIIESDKPAEALTLCYELGLLKYILPELEKGRGVDQNQAHSFDVWTHLLNSLAHAAKKGFPLTVRLAALFHDIGKPDTRRWSDEKKDYTFYGHEVVGARITEKILKDLKFPRELAEKVVNLVRWHMFFSDTEQITHSAVRRMVMNVGKDNVWELMDVRACDRIGTGRPKESPYRLRKYHSMVEEVMRDPISVGMLKIDGKRLMDVLKEPPGPRIGFILNALLEEVLEDPTKNTEEGLEKMATNMAKMSDAELRKIAVGAKEKKNAEEEKMVKEIRKKHWVE